MTLRLLHTADWQLGKPFHQLPAEVAPLLREARFAAVRTIAELATRHEVAAVLVAGDVFDGNLVPERTHRPGPGRHARLRRPLGAAARQPRRGAGGGGLEPAASGWGCLPT